MSKLAEKFALGKKALADRAALEKAASEGDASSSQSSNALTHRPAGPLHGSVSTMKIDMLQTEVRALRSGKPMVRIAPGEIRPSAWKNRHEDSFKSKEFEALKGEILSAGGNIQPIKIRPIAVTEGSPYKYEIVFGRRRHRACLDHGLDVLSMIEDLDDKHLFIEMDRENRQREDLRPYEQGVMYADALDKGLFPSLRKLAEEVGADATNVSKAVSLARLPPKVIGVFVSPLDIQFRWASELKAVLETDADVVYQRCGAIAKSRLEGKAISSAEAFNLLVGKNEKAAPVRPRLVKSGDRVLAITQKGNKVAFEIDGLSKDTLNKIEMFIAEQMKL